MKILIAGATGLIGQKLVDLCLEQNISVRYLTTRKSKISKASNYTGFYWNPAKNEIDTSAFDGVTKIVNLAGATVSKRWTNSYKEKILSSRVQSSRLIFESIRGLNHTVSHFICASGVSIYPNSISQVYTEDDLEVDNSFLAKVVQTWEQEADKFNDLDIAVSKLRTGVVLAKDEGAFPKLKKPINLGLGSSLGIGKQWMPWIHLDDVARMYLYVIQNKLTGIFNAVAPDVVTNKEMTRQVATKLGKPLWLPSVPGFVLKMLLGEMASLVLDGQNVSADKIEDAGFKFRYKTLTTALDDLT